MSSEVTASAKPAAAVSLRLSASHAVLAACVILLMPLFVVEVPPILDYPNHLARMWVLAIGPSDPILSSMFAPNWGIIPNLATDAVMVPLVRLLDPYTAGRLMLGLLLLLPYAGMIAYARAVFGKVTLWSAAGALVACNAVYLLGFMNFLMGCGIALLFAADWALHRELRPYRAIVTAAAGAVLLFFCHLMGLLFFLVLIGSQEIEATWRQWRGGAPLFRSLALRLLRAAPVLLGPALLYPISVLEAQPADPQWLSPTDKAVQALYPVINYSFPLDLITAAIIVVFLVSCAWKRTLDAPPRVLIALAVAAIAYAAAPFTHKATSFVDTRFAIMFGFVLFAGLRPRLPQRALTGSAIILFASLLCLRTGLVASVWHDYRSELSEIRRVIQPIQPGSRVLLATVSADEAPAYWETAPASRRISDGTYTDGHRAALVLLERRAFWPFVFANAWQQPLRVVAPFDQLQTMTGVVPPHRWLSNPQSMTNEEKDSFPIWRDWTNHYDYLLLLGAGGEPDQTGWARRDLRLLESGDAAALYKVERADSSSTQGTGERPGQRP